MKRLQITDDDIDFNNDWLIGEAEQTFLNGDYDCVEFPDGEVVEVETIKFDDGTSYGAALGETLIQGQEK